MVHNFSAGPAILPQSVFEEASKAVKELDGIGLSILEISHRSKEFTAILEEAIALVEELLGLPKNYKPLYLSGGASTQFFMSAMNLLNSNETAAYIDTGSWSTKAIKEAKLFGNIEVVASSKDKGYNYIPKEYVLPKEVKYLHLTSNNTIAGTQYHDFPDLDVPLVCDMSSDIFSRPIDVEKFGLIYAGAQKNMGPAGTTLVIVNEDLLGKVDRDIPSMLDYQVHIKKDSAYNTPPVFPIYVSMLVLRWVKKHGGVKAMVKRAEEKAQLIYSELERNELFVPFAATEDRSHMNVTFTIKNPDLEEAFLKYTQDANISGIKGHRSVGGFRASIYNAMEKSSVETLVEIMREFERTKA